MTFGVAQIFLLALIIGSIALLGWAVVALRRGDVRMVFARGIPGVVIAFVAVVLLWIATLLQTYLGLTGEIKAAHVVAKPVAGQQHLLDLGLTLFTDDGPVRSVHRVEGDIWALQANIVELEPWVNALGFHSGYKVSRLFGQRLDGKAVAQDHIFLNGSDADFFQSMNERRWYTAPFVRSAYGNAVVASPGTYDVFVSRDAIKVRPV
ncbi:hypothetical protein GCM10011591_13710 [Nocardia camponoti]|uniref:Uncharacterized protein n=1 Tax=Nocardia camponoti TaxID=1616106 RepID=A0A917QCR0_9NOCA|nr:hypothetical protein GCM10011591_13710 [Nocardia camponoti]